MVHSGGSGHAVGHGATPWGLHTSSQGLALALALLGGLLAALLAPVAPAPTWVVLALVAGLMLGLMWRVLARSATLRSTGLQRTFTGCLALALLGAGWAGWRIQQRLAVQLDPSLEGRNLVLVGRIATMPQRLAEGQRFVFEVDQAQRDGQPVEVPRTVLMSWFRPTQDDPFGVGPDSALAPGQRWQFGARLRAPHGLMNPHGFDAELWLFERNLRATGSVRANAREPAQRLGNSDGFALERWRQHVRDAIEARVPSPRAAGVLAALAVGDQSAISRGDWDVFRDTGIAHLMSISGLHVTMFAWLASALIDAAWRCWPRGMLHWPAASVARWGGLVCALGYALLSGWGVPAQRTWWMLATVTLLGSIGVRWPWPWVLAAAAVVVGVIDPWALLQPGFWLSFVAVGLLMFASPQRTPVDESASWQERARRAARGGVRTQAVATLGLAPLTLVWFQQVSLVGFVANLVSIPLVTLLVTPLALAGALWAPLWTVAAALVEGLSALLTRLAAWPWAVWSSAAAPLWAQAMGLAAGVLAVAPLPWRVRLMALPLALPLVVPAVPRPPHGVFEMLVADVGQGTAVLVRTRHHLLVYDSGPRIGAEADAGERVLLPLLRARGERAIHMLVLSHGDSDHIGGAASLMQALPVHAWSSSLEPQHPLRAMTVSTAATHQPCQAGMHWHWDGVDFELLHPRADDLARVHGGDDAMSTNALSCVLRVRGADGRRALLTGDIEAREEAALLARERDGKLRAEVLLVPHHGSRTSSTAEFIEAVSPTVALVQAGYRNRYGHPAPDVWARLQAPGRQVERSDACGAWRWQGNEMQCERPGRPAHWRHVLPRP